MNLKLDGFIGIKKAPTNIFKQYFIVIILIFSSTICFPGYLNIDHVIVSGGGGKQAEQIIHHNSRDSVLGIDIGPNQTAYGRFGEVISYKLSLVNNQTVSDYIDLTYTSGPSDWAVTLFEDDGINVLKDSTGDDDGIPDTGLLSPQEAFDLIVKVTVPLTQAFNQPEITLVTASSSLSPAPHESSCKLTTKAYPNLDATKSASPTRIYVESAESLGLPTRTRVTLNVKGGGIPTMIQRYHDVVFLIDNTGSMITNDPFKVRIDAANQFVDNMSGEDRGAVVTFYGGTAYLARGPFGTLYHLTSDNDRVKSNINWSGLTVGGGTNILKAVQLGNDELINYGNLKHIWYQILLTDGRDSFGQDPGIRNEAQRAANNNIVIFTISLGNDTNEKLLKDVANITGGKFFQAQNATQLIDIYKQIQFSVSRIAGQDPNPSDDESMIKDVLPSYISVVPDSFQLEPGSIASKPEPSKIEYNPNNTTFNWNVKEILINQSWLVSFEVTSSKTGWVTVGLYPDSRVNYNDWNNNTEYELAFPEVWVEVLPVPRADVVPVDVMVNGNTFDPSESIMVQRGEPVTISAKARNIGVVSTKIFADEFHIGFFNSSQPDKPFKSSSIDGLEVDGVSSSHDAIWTAPYTLDLFIISIVVDWQDVLPEGDIGESNNVLNLTFNVTHDPIIDLIPVNLKIDEENKSIPVIDILEIEVEQELKIELQVENRGNDNTNYYTSEFNVDLYNRTEPEASFGSQIIYSLQPGGQSRSLVFLWSAPIEPGIIELEIAVDSTNTVPEGPQGEQNNKVLITFKVIKKVLVDLIPLKLAINGVPKDIYNTTSQKYETSHDLVIGQHAEISFSIMSSGNVPTSYFAPEFQIVIFNITDTAGSYLLRANINNLDPGQASEVIRTFWQAPVTTGSFTVILNIDHFNAITEADGGELNNIVTIVINVYELVGQPEPGLVIDKVNKDVILEWNSVEDAVSYEIFGGRQPDKIDFGRPMRTTSDLMSRQLSALVYYNEYYYCLRAVDERGWTGPTSSIVGFFTKEFVKGYNSFSLPLEPFEIRTADWYADDMLIMDFETIYDYDKRYDKWIGHPKFLPGGIDDFELQMGYSYMLFSTRNFNYTFTGHPETMIRFIQGVPGDEWLGSNLTNDVFRTSLRLTRLESGLKIEWSKLQKSDGSPMDVKYYEIYRRSRRGGLNITNTDQGYPQIEDPAQKLVTSTRLTKFIDTTVYDLLAAHQDLREGTSQENLSGDQGGQGVSEFHYIVVPVDKYGRRGSSTYSGTISSIQLQQGYNSYGMTLVGSKKTFVYDRILSIGTSSTDTIYYYDTPIQHWIGHPRFLPEFRDNPMMVLGEGYQIFILSESNKILYQLS